jgi:hypothetical protein
LLPGFSSRGLAIFVFVRLVLPVLLLLALILVLILIVRMIVHEKSLLYLTASIVLPEGRKLYVKETDTWGNGAEQEKGRH